MALKIRKHGRVTFGKMINHRPSGSAVQRVYVDDVEVATIERIDNVEYEHPALRRLKYKAESYEVSFVVDVSDPPEAFRAYHPPRHCES